MIGGLYLITDNDHDGHLPQRVAQALAGGARMVQYRDKESTDDRRQAMAVRLRELCRQAGAAFIVNDDAHLARACGADGIHLGQGDMPVAQARALLGPRAIIGVSARSVELARKAQADGADYLGVGAVYPTGTKDDAKLIGLEALAAICTAVELPVIAIGGIDRDGAPGAIDAGADGLAVVSAVMGAPCPRTAAQELALLFNRRLPHPRGRVLTIAGSDSGGGAGIQADIKTVTLLGGYAASAITALTAQNTCGVRGIHPVPEEFVAGQVEAVLSDIGADVVKTGMLYDADIIEAVAAALERHRLPAVVDPVMIAKGGAPLLQQQAVEALKGRLLPRTYLLTPNLPEAEVLTGIAIGGEAEMERAARALQQMGARNVLLKGGHLEGAAVDLLLDGDHLHRLPAERVPTGNTHGTGCTYSAAIAALLAQGEPLPVAVQRAKAFIHQAIKTAVPLGSGHGPVNHWQAAQTITNART